MPDSFLMEELTPLSKSGPNPRRVAFGGVISALCLAVLFLSGVFPFAEYAIPAAAGLFLTALVIDFGKPIAWLCWGAVSLLALFVVPNKEAALLFACLFGPYPILKSVLEHLPSRILEWICKLLIFNAGAVAAYALLVFAFGIQEALDSMQIPGLSLSWSLLLFLIGGNVVFLLYDYALSGLIAFYLQQIRPKLKLPRQK